MVLGDGAGEWGAVWRVCMTWLLLISWTVLVIEGLTRGRLMNFLPEWLSGCESLDTADPVHL